MAVPPAHEEEDARRAAGLPMMREASSGKGPATREQLRARYHNLTMLRNRLRARYHNLTMLRNIFRL